MDVEILNAQAELNPVEIAFWLLLALVPHVPLLYALLRRVSEQIDVFDVTEETHGLIALLLVVPEEFLAREMEWSRLHPWASRLIKDLHEIVHGGHRGQIPNDPLGVGPGLTLGK